MTLYYRYIYMPPKFLNMPHTILKDFIFTNHAIEALEDDDLQVFDELEFSGKNIIEVETDRLGRCTYMLVEKPIDFENNLYVAFCHTYKPKEPYVVKQTNIITVYIGKHCNDYIVNKTNPKYYRPINMSFERDVVYEK